jgi:hypothetical protein
MGSGTPETSALPRPSWRKRPGAMAGRNDERVECGTVEQAARSLKHLKPLLK